MRLETPQDISSRRAAFDVGAQVAGQLVNAALGVVAVAVLARALGETDFGRWTTLLVVTSLVGTITDLGLRQVAVQRAAAERDPRWIGAFVGIRLAVSLPAGLLALGVLLAVADTPAMRVAGAVLAVQLLVVGASALATVFQVRVRNVVSVGVMTANSLLWTSAVVLLARADAGIVAFAGCFVAIGALTAGLQAALALRSTRIRLRPGRRLWRELVRVGVPVGLGTILIVAYSKIDGLLVYEISGARQAGLYGAAYRILDRAQLVPTALATTLLPVVASAYVADRARARRALELALEWMAMVSLPALAFTIAAGRPAIVFVFGADFAEAGQAMVPLMAAFVAICFGYAFVSFTLVLGLQRRFVGYALAALLLNVGANLALLPRYGFEAAAWITLATEVVVAALIGRDVARAVRLRLRWSRYAGALAAATVTALATAALRDEGVGFVGLLTSACAVHAAALLGFGALRPSELRAVLRRPAPAAAPVAAGSP